ncbi:hypothetical protein [Treponema sp.]|uniref:hypothetical protein n=1 Tax=Treponema sp. TaxID=166 RepID=UPI00298D63C0|nr:hypothetical protein [Treponema sp.]MCQ2241008.1 hypothetical protein [Treponema sp.]
MKKIALLAASVLMTGSLFAFDNDLLEFKGKAESYTKTEYSVTSRFGEYFRTVAIKHVHTFANGLRMETVSYSPKDEVLDSVSYEYTSGGKLSAEISKDAEGKVTRKLVYEYSADGKIKSETAYNAADVLTGKNIYKYEANRTSESLYNAEGKLVSRVNHILENGKEIEVAYYFGDGTLSHAEKYSYTDNGDIALIENIDSDGNKAGKTVYRYDDKGFLSEIQIYASDTDLIERDIYKNDAKGNPTKVSIYSIAEKFGSTVNELISITDYSYGLSTANAK